MKSSHKLTPRQRKRADRQHARRQVWRVWQEHQEELEREELALLAFLEQEEMEREAFLPELDEYADTPARPRSRVDEQFEGEYWGWVDAVEASEFERQDRVADEAEVDMMLEESEALCRAIDSAFTSTPQE